MFPEYVALSRCEWLMKLSSFFFPQKKTKTENMAYPLLFSDTWNRNFRLPYSPLSSHLSRFLRLALCISRLVPCRVLEGHRRIISPWNGRIGGGLHVDCSLSRCIQMINYKYRSELGGGEGGTDRRRKGSLENYSRHAARKKRIYEWDVPSHWCRCGRLVPALISSKFNWV